MAFTGNFTSSGVTFFVHTIVEFEVSYCNSWNIPERCENSFVDYRINYKKLCYSLDTNGPTHCFWLYKLYQMKWYPTISTSSIDGLPFPLTTLGRPTNEIVSIYYQHTLWGKMSQIWLKSNAVVRKPFTWSVPIIWVSHNQFKPLGDQGLNLVDYIRHHKCEAAHQKRGDLAAVGFFRWKHAKNNTENDNNFLSCVNCKIWMPWSILINEVSFQSR